MPKNFLLKDTHFMTLLTKPPAEAPHTPPQPDPASRPAADRGWFRAFLLRIHFYAGILAGPFLLVAAVSGGLYAMAPSWSRPSMPRNCTFPL